MITMSAYMDDPTFSQWAKVNDIIWPHIKDTREWRERGFGGISHLTQELFGFRVERNSKSYVEYIFDSEEDYVWFKLKWF